MMRKKTFLSLIVIFVWVVTSASGCTPDCNTAVADYNVTQINLQTARDAYNGANAAFMMMAQDPNYGPNVVQDTMDEYSRALSYAFSVPPTVPTACTDENVTQIVDATTKVKELILEYENQTSILDRGIDDLRD